MHGKTKTMSSSVHDSFIEEHFNSLCRFCMQSTVNTTSQFEKLIKNKQICKQFSEYFGIKVGRNIQNKTPSHSYTLVSAAYQRRRTAITHLQ
jgi:hypothetical protein